MAIASPQVGFWPVSKPPPPPMVPIGHHPHAGTRMPLLRRNDGLRPGAPVHPPLHARIARGERAFTSTPMGLDVRRSSPVTLRQILASARGDKRLRSEPSRPLHPSARELVAGVTQCLVCGTTNPLGRKCNGCTASEDEMRELLTRRDDTFPPHLIARAVQFHTPPAAHAELVWSQAVRLHTQSGLPIDPAQILESPWVGSTGTSAGWLRDADRFWRAFRVLCPEMSKLLGYGKVVTVPYALHMRWPAWTVCQPLEVHHIDNQALVAPLPAPLHSPRTKRRRM